MSRSRSNRVSQVKEKLVARLGLGLFQGGDRFLSVRAITRQYDVSYQTADRLLRELTLEGRLRREHGSGTYVAGGTKLTKVQLVFNRRARRAGSFGSRLLSAIVLRLRQSGIPVVQTFVDQDQPARLSDDAYPILWEAAAAVDFLGQRGSTGMMVNGRPPPGLMALKIDSVAIDDGLGGACAGELIARRVSSSARVAVLAGPRDDPRSTLRVNGFLLKHPAATVTHAINWFREDARRPAKDILTSRPEAIFACNDRLAQAVVEAAAELEISLPVLFGFDDAPVAETLHLSTISIPWDELADAIATTAKQRLAGDTTPSIHRLLSPRPVIRLT